MRLVHVLERLLSDRFLDPVNPDNLHNNGNTERGFLRFDYASPDFKDTVRITALIGHTHRDVPNTYTQEAAGQDQQVKSRDENFNLGWTHLLSSKATFDLTASARLARFQLFPSVNDTPVTATSDRTLDNYSVTPSFTYASGIHEVKVGGIYKSFPIDETFSFGLTDPAFNDPQSDGYNPDLAPYDLTRGGQPLFFQGKRTGTLLRAATSRTTSGTRASLRTWACATTTTICRPPRTSFSPASVSPTTSRRRGPSCGPPTTGSS